MSPSQDIVKPQFELRVNGIADPAIRFRMPHDEPDDFDVIVDDANLGTLAITADCILELREAGTAWRTVTLDDLKGVLLGASESLTTDDWPKTSETVERPRFDRLDQVGVIHRRSPQFADLTGHSDCLKRVQSLFYRVGLPHKSAGTVFVVPDLRLARAVLCQGGFYPSPISPVALVEPQTRCAVQLIEQRV
jgi:hypothetical protein